MRGVSWALKPSSLSKAGADGMGMRRSFMVLHSVQASCVWAGLEKAKVEKSGDR